MILRGNVFSKVLEMDTGLTVFVPNKFVGGNYKVAYLLHGMCGDSDSWIDNTLLPVYAANYDCIFIMPEAVRSLYTDMKYGQKYFKYISDELPRICQSLFNISHKREDTAIIGGSMGGYGALKCALSKPNQYSYCGALAAAFLYMKECFDDQQDKIKVEAVRAQFGERFLNDFKAAFGEDLEWKAQDEILCLAKEAKQKEIMPKIYMACGNKDFLLDSNRRFKADMLKLGADLTYEEWDGSHEWQFFNDALKGSLENWLEK